VVVIAGGVVFALTRLSTTVAAPPVTAAPTNTTPATSAPTPDRSETATTRRRSTPRLTTPPSTDPTNTDSTDTSDTTDSTASTGTGDPSNAASSAYCTAWNNIYQDAPDSKGVNPSDPTAVAQVMSDYIAKHATDIANLVAHAPVGVSNETLQFTTDLSSAATDASVLKSSTFKTTFNTLEAYGKAHCGS